MTATIVRLPTGTQTPLEELNLHDLRQYYMYQMDMLSQAEDALSSLGVAGWSVEENVDNRLAIARNKKSPTEFLAPPAEGNLLPSFYDAGGWQGVVSDGKFRTYPFVEKMEQADLHQGIARLQHILTNFQVGTTALVNLAKNIQNATQPPALPENDTP